MTTQTLATGLFIQQLVGNDNKENIKALHCWPFVRGVHLSPVDSPHKGSVMRKVFHGMILSSQVSQIFYQCFNVTFCPNQSFLFPKYGKSQILPRAMCRFIMSMVSENISLQKHNNGLVPDCSISIADAMEIPQSWAKPLPCKHVFRQYKDVFYNVLFVHVTWCMAWLFNQPVKTCHRCPSPTGKIIIQCIRYTLEFLQQINNVLIKPFIYLFFLEGLNMLRPAISKWIFFEGNNFVLIKMSPKFVHRGPFVNKSASVQMMACCLTGNKPLPEPMLTEMSDGIWCHWTTMNW